MRRSKTPCLDRERLWNGPRWHGGTQHTRPACAFRSKGSGYDHAKRGAPASILSCRGTRNMEWRTDCGGCPGDKTHRRETDREESDCASPEASSHRVLPRGSTNGRNRKRCRHACHSAGNRPSCDDQTLLYRVARFEILRRCDRYDTRRTVCLRYVRGIPAWSPRLL